jgi:hypothetical protein
MRKSKIVEEMADHATEIAIWCLRTLKRHKIGVLDETDHPDALEFHLTRLESLLDEVDYPLTDSLMEEDFTKRIKPLDRKRKGYVLLTILLLALVVSHYTVQAASPNEMLHASPTIPPNNNVTLPYVR